ncbi:MAG: hypothetical protein EWV65_05910 [Microcystis flos-aquae Ma_QC_C_20070823_S18D]|nr:MAG: hypothetical protein EWV65_05910 [Microcystis flos-aquae Ma_QC_C_20070823_S18D]
MISLTYIGSINLCVLCVFVVRSTPSLGGMYLRIHFLTNLRNDRLNFSVAIIFLIHLLLIWLLIH